MDDDYIGRHERIFIAMLGKSWLWRMSRVIIGVIPPVGSLVMLVHCIFLTLGIRIPLTEWIFDCSVFGFVAWIIVSLAYGFCWVHRAFITYGMLISFCIDFQRTIGFGCMLQPLHLAASIIGILLFAFFIKNKVWEEFYIRNINHLEGK